MNHHCISPILKIFRAFFSTVALIYGSLIPVKGQVLINEIQASNIHTKQDQFGDYSDWIELYNSGIAEVNLSGYGLSDDISKPWLFQFPDISIPAHSHLLVFASDSMVTDIRSHWETALSANSTWSYRANTFNPPDTNWRNLSFNDNWLSGTGGIGYGDGDDGTIVSTCVSIYMRQTFSIPDISKIKAAVFNMDYDDAFVAYLNGVEIARMNVGTKGDRPSWNSLALAAHEALMYQGGEPDSFFLDVNLLKEILVNGTNVLAIEVHNQSVLNNDLTCNAWLSFLVDDGVNYFGSVPSFFRAAADNYLHAPFKLSRSGETVFLVDASGAVIDEKYSGILEPDNSIGRNPDGSTNWCLFSTPSPSSVNNSPACATGYASSPVFSKSGGFYKDAQTLMLSSNDPTSQIRYTIDGSDVTSASSLYTLPIRIDTSLTIRAAAFSVSMLASPVITNTYFIGVTTKLPVFSLTTDPANLWDYNSGIFVKGPNAGTTNPYWGANFWQDWEKPITLEYYDRSKNRTFRFNSGMKITGGWSRSAPQKSLEIMLGDRYGQSKLNYALEESVKPWLDEWDDFILHTTGNDRNLCKMRDPLMNRLLQSTHNDFLAYEPCMLFINGQNWGVYYIRENDDHHWIESNYGYHKDEVDLLKESYFYPSIEVKKGSDSAFFVMHEYAMNTSPSDPAFYSTMSSFMDLDNMTDYFIAETYYPNDDWMGGSNNNLKLWRPRKEGGKFRYLIYDLDFGLGYSGTVTNNMLSVARNASPHNYNSDLFRALTNNSEYKRYFINRYADLVNTIFLPSNVESMVNLFRDSIKQDMHFQWDAWGGDSITWISKINSMITFANQRPAYARNFIQSEFGLSGQVALTIQAQPAEAGRILISTVIPDGLPWTGVYFNGNPVTITAIPNPGYSFDHWKSNGVINQNNYNQTATFNFTSNDLITCYFSGSAAPLDIAFSEINYNSYDTLDSGDWLELKNSASYPLDISGWKLRDEEDHHCYLIPTGTSIPAGAYLVLASNLNKFSEVFPTVQNVIGDFGFDFSNGGENLRLYNHRDSLLMSVYYQDQLPWPSGADGHGYTLEIADINQDANNGSNWFDGCLGGSPGGPYQAPMVSVSTSGSLSFCQGDSLVLNASSSPGAMFQWKKDDFVIDQATEDSYTASVSGLYQVQVTSNGCSALSDTLHVTVLPPEQITSTTPAQHCEVGDMQLSATGTSLLNWYAAPSGGVVLGTGNSFLTPVLQQSTSYYVCASGACTSPCVEVIAEILPVNAMPVIQDVDRCGPGEITLVALDTAMIRWFDAPVGGNLLATGSSFYISALQQTEIFYASAGALCPSSRLPVQALIKVITEDPLVNDAGRCGPGSLILNAASADQLGWYDDVGGNLLDTGNVYTTPHLSQSATYYVQAGLDCPSAFVPVNAIIHELPLPQLGNDTMIGSGTQLVLDPGQGFISYNWSDGSTLSTLTVISGGQFSVTVIDMNGCVGSDSVSVMLATGINADTFSEFSVFPNPASTYCLVEFGNAEATAEIRLIDYSGRILMRKNLNGGKELVLLSLEGISAGLYQIQYISKEKFQSKTIIIQ